MAFRGNSYKPKTKKKKGGSLYYPYTDEDMKRVGWCMNKNIHVAVSPSETNWKVEIRKQISLPDFISIRNPWKSCMVDCFHSNEECMLTEL